VNVSGSDGSTYTLKASGGTQAVTPKTTTTYTTTAVGIGGTATATATATVTVTPAPTVSISANPASIIEGASSTLTVAATNASTVNVSGSDGSSYSLTASGGTQAVTPKTTTTYTATVVGSGGKATATATLTVTPAPTVSIAASPASITEGASSTLTVAATNASTVNVSGSDGSSYSLTASGGTQAVTPSTTTTYTATASSGSVQVTATAIITVAAPAPAAFAYISTSPNSSGGNSSTSASVLAYATAANGQLTLVASSSLATTEQLAGAAGNYIFTIDPQNVHAYTIESNGSVGSQASEINTQLYGGGACGTTSGASFLDRTGKFLTVELYYNPGVAPCDAWQTYQISSGGQLTFVGDLENTSQYVTEAGASPLGISTVSGNNQFAYGIVGEEEANAFTAFQRASSGDLLWNSQFSEVDPAPGPTGYTFFPLNIAADPSNHLAVLVYQAFAPYPDYLNLWLASYTVDSTTGSIQSTNTYANMPLLTVTSTSTMAISPSGKFLAVGSGSEQTPVLGLQIFNFNGADPATPYGNLMLPNVSISQVAWDNNNHLYVLSSASSQVYVYTVTATSITEAPGSPMGVPNASKLIVVPGS
jgi:hypothetical protein